MDVFAVILTHYDPSSKAYLSLVHHGRAVADKAIAIARRLEHLEPDIDFIEEAALLHDIGMIMTRLPALDCFGEHPYISHGYLGREMLDNKGLHRHALVCERHVGTGLTVEDIIRDRMPLPLRDMQPQSVEEQLICFADKFFTKRDGLAAVELPLEKVRRNIARYGEDKLRRFDEWCVLFREME